MTVISDLIEAGVSEFVLCGGARNAPLIEAAVAAAEANPEIRTWRQFDERSAGFFALGRTMAHGLPCAVIVTSGTAAAELLPAVIEAHYQARPLVLVTADRPEEYQGKGTPQGIDQHGIYSSYAEEVALDEWSGSRPLHLNVPLEEDAREDSEIHEVGAFSPVRASFAVAPLASFLIEDVYRGLVIMVGGLDLIEREDVFHFCQAVGAPVVADPASGLRELLGKRVLPDADALLRAKPPGKILRLGQVPVGRFWRDLESLQGIEVLSICRNGLPGLARESQIIKGDVGRVIRGLGEPPHVGDALDHLRLVNVRQAGLDELCTSYPMAEQSIIRTLSVIATTGNSVFLGNSLPVREWGDFGQKAVPMDEVRAMRGANGIDGQVSCWLGSSVDEEESWAILGDLTTLYDLQGMAMAEQVEGRRVLLVINNGGGRIFDRLPRLETMSGQAKEGLIQKQEMDLKGAADLWGWDFHKICSEDGFDLFDDLQGEKILVEICPDEPQTGRFLNGLKQLRSRRI